MKNINQKWVELRVKVAMRDAETCSSYEEELRILAEALAPNVPDHLKELAIQEMQEELE